MMMRKGSRSGCFNAMRTHISHGITVLPATWQKRRSRFYCNRTWMDEGPSWSKCPRENILLKDIMQWLIALDAEISQLQTEDTKSVRRKFSHTPMNSLFGFMKKNLNSNIILNNSQSEHQFMNINIIYWIFIYQSDLDGCRLMLLDCGTHWMTHQRTPGARSGQVVSI